MKELPHPILAIDYGDARIGIAATDTTGILPHPVATIKNSPKALEEILKLIHLKSIRSILIGLPLRADGTEGASALKVRTFHKQLTSYLTKVELTKLVIDFIDESHTTIQASSKLSMNGKSLKKQKNIIDQAAAVEILERFLQSQSNPFGLLEDPHQEF